MVQRVCAALITMKQFSKVFVAVDVPLATPPTLTPPLLSHSGPLYWDMSPLRSTHSTRTFLLLSHPDVNSWLLTFGFQLHNVIPGYPKPDMDAMEPSYELVHTQMKTQEWDNSKVICAHTATHPQARQTLWEWLLQSFSGKHGSVTEADVVQPQCLPEAVQEICSNHWQATVDPAVTEHRPPQALLSFL